MLTGGQTPALTNPAPAVKPKIEHGGGQCYICAIGKTCFPSKVFYKLKKLASSVASVLNAPASVKYGKRWFNYRVSRKFWNITFFTIFVPVAKANITPSAFHMLRVEDIAVHPNQSQLLPRGMFNLVWDVHFLTLGKSQN